MDEHKKKVKGGAEKLRERKKQKLHSEARSCHDIQNLFTKIKVIPFAIVKLFSLIHFLNH